MATIDKIYGTREQYDEFHKWCSDHYPNALEYFYGWDWNDDNVHPITNFPIEIDGYLLIICDIAWVVDRIKDQHNLIIPLEQQNATLVAALDEIAKGEGPYSQNRVTHAENTINHLVLIAIQALAEIKK